MRYHLIMENVAGKLDEEFARTLDDAKRKLINMVVRSDLRDGDVFRIVDDRPED